MNLFPNSIQYGIDTLKDTPSGVLVDIYGSALSDPRKTIGKLKMNVASG